MIAVARKRAVADGDPERNALGAGPGWVVPMGLAIIAGLTLADALWVGETITSTVVLAPFVVSLLSSPRETAVVGGLAVLSALLSPLWNHNFGDVDYVVRLAVVIAGALFALVGARSRARLARDRMRFQMLSGVAETSERGAGVDETLENLSDILVPAIADVCAIDLLRDGKLERLAVAAHGPHSSEIAAGLRERGKRGGTSGTGAETLIRDYEDATLREAALDEDDLDFLRSLGIRSGMTVPLRARGRRIGTLALAMTSLSGRDYDEEDLAFARVLSGRVALALDNAGLFSEVETLAARQAAALGSLAEAVTMQDHTGALVYANDAAARALGYASPEEMLTTPAEEIAEAFDSFHEDGSPLRFDELPGRRVLAGEDPAPLVLRTISRRTGEERWRVTKATGVRDADGRVRLAVNVIEDVTEVKHAEQAQRLLAQAGQVLASSLDYEETLAQVAQLAIGELADWCGVTLPGQRGMLRSVAVAHVDPAKVRFAHELNERFPQRMDEPGGAADVLRTGASQVINEITDELLEQSVADPQQLEPIRELGMRAAMIVPMVAGGRAIGVISFVSAESRRTFSAADLELAEELGRRAGTAVENARLYTERSHIADTLQASLLPAGLPAMPGFSLASLYRPAGEENWVGGDFYDAFPTTAGWMVLVGDVAGRGAEAAALTGQARHTLRTAAQLLSDPLGALGHLNRALTELPTTSLCTVGALHLVETGGVVQATVVCAGHPKPYLVRDDVPVQIGNWGPMVGAFADSVWRPETRDARPRRRPRALHRRGHRRRRRRRTLRRRAPDRDAARDDGRERRRRADPPGARAVRGRRPGRRHRGAGRRVHGRPRPRRLGRRGARGRAGAAEAERVGDELVGAPPRGVVVGDRHDHDLLRVVVGGDLLDARAHLVARAQDRAAGAGGVGSAAVLGQVAQRLVDRRDRARLPAAQQRHRHATARRQALGLVVVVGRQGPHGHHLARGVQAWRVVEALAVDLGQLGAAGVDEVRERVREAELRRPDRALRRRSEQPRLGRLREARQRRQPGERVVAGQIVLEVGQQLRELVGEVVGRRRAAVALERERGAPDRCPTRGRGRGRCAPGTGR